MWFNESAESRNDANAYRDYYMWQDPRAGCQLENPEECYPNNWVRYSHVFLFVLVPACLFVLGLFVYICLYLPVSLNRIRGGDICC